MSALTEASRADPGELLHVVFDSHATRRRSAPRAKLFYLALRLALPVGVIVAWQALSSLGSIESQFLPSPRTLVTTAQELWQYGALQEAIPVSLGRAAAGLALGASIGLVLGIAAGLWVAAERLYDAPLQMLRTIPFIAMVPLFIVWFGVGEESKILLIMVGAIFPVYLNTFHAIRNIDRKLIELGSTFDLSYLDVIRLVVLPTALPGVLVGVRFAAGAALLGLVAAEQINSQAGIGYLVSTAAQTQRPDIIIVGIVIYALLGVALDLTMRTVERAALPWRATHDGRH